MTELASILGTKSVIFMGGKGAGPSARPGAENWPLVFPELLGRLNADPKIGFSYLKLHIYQVFSATI